MSGIDKLEKRLKAKTEKPKGQTARQLNLRLSEGIVITGMHRSGTSMVAALVEKMGVSQLGQKPKKPAADNPDGFWEDLALQKISDGLLAASGHTWSNLGGEMTSRATKINETFIDTARNDVYQLRQDIGEPWFIKDPKICLVFEEWSRILLLKVPVIFIVRNPHDVASSLMQRDLIAQQEALALWYRYNRTFLNSLRNVNNLVLDYDATCEKPKSAQSGVETFLERTLSRASNESFKVTNQVVFNPRKTESPRGVSKAQLSQESEDCLELYASLRSLHLTEISGKLQLRPEPEWVRDALDRAHAASQIRTKLAHFETKTDFLLAELAASRGLLSDRDVELSRLQAEAEKERTVLEGQLADVETKADYLFDELATSVGERTVLEGQLAEVEAKANFLFAELATSRGSLNDRNQLVDLLQRKLRSADLELTRLTIHQTSLEFQINALKRVDAERLILEDVSLYLLEDLRRLTSKRTYRIFRKFKIFVRKLLTLNSDQTSLRNDVIPAGVVDLDYLGRILELQLHSAEYLEMYSDIKKSGVNPYSHYLKKGESEGRAIPQKPLENR